TTWRLPRPDAQERGWLDSLYVPGTALTLLEHWSSNCRTMSQPSHRVQDLPGHPDHRASSRDCSRVGWSPFPFSVALALSVGVSLAAAACYGVASVYTKVYVRGASSTAVATCSQLGAALFL